MHTSPEQGCRCHNQPSEDLIGKIKTRTNKPTAVRTRKNLRTDQGFKPYKLICKEW